MEGSNPPPWRAQGDRRPPRQEAPAKVLGKRKAQSQEEKWVADEDRFVLQQAKKKSIIRVRGGRARPIDWLAITLRAIDPSKEPLDDGEDEADLDTQDPEALFESLDDSQLVELGKDIDTFLTLETSNENRDYWKTLKIICQDRLQKTRAAAPGVRGINAVAADVDKILAPKSYDQLQALEKQVRAKLNSDEDIDVDYWEHLLQNLMIWKAKAKLRKVTQTITAGRLDRLKQQQVKEALVMQNDIRTMLENINDAAVPDGLSVSGVESVQLLYDSSLDPDPSLKLRQEDKLLSNINESTFVAHILAERRRVIKAGYIPETQHVSGRSLVALPARTIDQGSTVPRFAPPKQDDSSQATLALYEREVARGVSENEEIFASEEEVTTTSKAQWSNKYRPRKPRYFNRVQMGYEWNKYNQTHYDHDNPPPKVVQGYKFNVFYPDLIDQTKTPRYRIEREGGRKRGESFAPAGEDDSCLIRFTAGPPYEDIAFRIVDKEWDFSSRRDRGFRCEFDKVYYRK